MQRKGHVALDGAMACLAFVAATTIIAISPASADDSANIPPALKCADLTGWTVPGSTASVTKAEEVPEAPPGTVQPSPPAPATVSVALPPNCRVDGVIDQRVGVDGKPYAIGFAVALPDRWNGRFLFQGGGGLNGTIRPPLGYQAAGEVPALARGFAVVSTDSGHQGAVFDASFLRDQEAALNFATASVGKVTIAAKAIVTHYYGQGAKHSYFTGCSTGGREAMLASARYPDQFDGIVAGAPAMRTGNSNIGLAWVNAAFSRIAPKDASGKPEPAKAFSADERKLITNAILDACDAKDGVKDGLIFDRKACQFDPEVLTCKGDIKDGKSESCLAPQQVDALRKAFAGPKNSRGTQVYPPFPWDGGVAAEGVAIPGILTTGARSPVGPPVWESIDVDQLEDRVNASGMDRLANTAYWTNLSSFFGHGGKLLFYHGVSDPWFSANDTVNYYERMAAESGGMETVREKSSRAFLVPGMGHCSSGATLDRFDLLTAIVNWVEDGKAPDAVVATGPAFLGRSRPLCAYPQHAQYKGQGDPESAASFECR
ncbi:tannase/feruloyl esterase family alpha/beta hydrolase [Bradyrhizobium guangzhouense]|uniref:Tannase/feruloyl esterase family alpha/beta hydrolase n=2 Tax=Bradyrhizobium guangzhouense TaxID=1325095 RepID=A0AAE5X1M2_9BRAD|nr:tannase/feruloyl esterase family alpha/beta hydrolase [Bradyrhizobium guangzhouense]RXH13721.1 tannase/feruloyl esterase family alpha/beta hydrolase [Bradyrhizobium guangzhouense]